MVSHCVTVVLGLDARNPPRGERGPPRSAEIGNDALASINLHIAPREVGDGGLPGYEAPDPSFPGHHGAIYREVRPRPELGCISARARLCLGSRLELGWGSARARLYLGCSSAASRL